MIVIPHFAHFPDIACPISTGESVRHMQMKQQARSLFKSVGLRARESFRRFGLRSDRRAADGLIQWRHGPQDHAAGL
jgi:hypothetical protein